MLWSTHLGRGVDMLHERVRTVRGQRVHFNVHYWGADASHYDNFLHTHSFFEICYVVVGTGRYIDGGFGYPLTDGTLFLSRPGVPHQIRSDTGLELLFVAFQLQPVGSSAEWTTFYEKMETTDHIVVQSADATTTAKTWEVLMRAAAEDEHPETLHSLAMALLTSFPNVFTRARNDPRPVRSVSANPVVERAILFIRDNLGHTLQLDKVASYLHVSGRHLSRLFRQTTGTSYNSFVQSERVARARTLLTETVLPIKEIAEACGFSSVHYFTRVFTQHERETPGRYRQMRARIQSLDANGDC